METLQSGITVGWAIHERCILDCVFIGVPLGIGSKQSIFINAFSNVGCRELWSESEFDLNFVCHPLIMCEVEFTNGICCSEDTDMINFNDTGSKKFSFC